MNSDFSPVQERLGVVPQDETKRVLIVENELETADFLADLLESQGYAVEVATEGNFGISIADRFEPHVILLSIDLPGIGGHDVARTLRNEPRFAQRFRNTRIYFLSTKEQMLSKRFDALPGTPMTDYIFKPVDMPELLDKVAKATSS
jgi:CheY-like chemotaxis protein